VLQPPVEPRQFTSWAFGDKIRAAGLMPSFGSVGDGLDNAMIESFGPPCRSNCSTARSGRPGSSWASAIFEYIEIFHNRQRRHSALGHRTPTEYEQLSDNNIPA
jgi:transposase InsO family protein